MTAARALFPIVVKDASFAALDVAARYVVASNGVFLEQATPLFAAGVPVEGVVGLERVAGLRSHAAWLRLAVPPPPRILLEQAVGFFRAVHQRTGGEGIVLMFYAPPTARRAAPRWRFEAPPQALAGAWRRGVFQAEMRLAYGSCGRPGPDFVRLGTIHSHGAGAAYHSSTDVRDEVGGAGLHVTVGRVDRPAPELAAAFVVGRTRFPLAVAEVLPRVARAQPPPRRWLRRVLLVARRNGPRAPEVRSCG